MSKMKESARKGTDVEGRKQRIDEGRGTGQMQNKDRETLGWRMCSGGLQCGWVRAEQDGGPGTHPQDAKGIDT